MSTSSMCDNDIKDLHNQYCQQFQREPTPQQLRMYGEKKEKFFSFMQIKAYLKNQNEQTVSKNIESTT